jgi:hypothetical protein
VSVDENCDGIKEIKSINITSEEYGKFLKPKFGKK